MWVFCSCATHSLSLCALNVHLRLVRNPSTCICKSVVRKYVTRHNFLDIVLIMYSTSAVRLNSHRLIFYCWICYRCGVTMAHLDCLLSTLRYLWFLKTFPLRNANNSFLFPWQLSSFRKLFEHKYVCTFAIVRAKFMHSTQNSFACMCVCVCMVRRVFFSTSTWEHKYSHHCYIYFVCSSIELDDLWKIQMFFFVWLFLGLFCASNFLYICIVIRNESDSFALLSFVSFAHNNSNKNKRMQCKINSAKITSSGCLFLHSNNLNMCT